MRMKASRNGECVRRGWKERSSPTRVAVIEILIIAEKSSRLLHDRAWGKREHDAFFHRRKERMWMPRYGNIF